MSILTGKDKVEVN